MSDRPVFDSLYQITADTATMKPVIHNKPSDFHPIIRLQILTERPLNPTREDVAIVSLGNKNDITGAVKQPLQSQPHHVFGHRISELAGEASYLSAVLLTGSTNGIAWHVKQSLTTAIRDWQGTQGAPGQLEATGENRTSA